MNPGFIPPALRKGYKRFFWGVNETDIGGRILRCKNNVRYAESPHPLADSFCIEGPKPSFRALWILGDGGGFFVVARD